MTDSFDVDFDLGDDQNPAAPAKKAKPAKVVGNPRADRERVNIILEENEQIPPNGLFLGCNGESFILQPGEKASVPVELIEILDNAIQSLPVVQDGQIIRYRDGMRFPYRRVA